MIPFDRFVKQALRFHSILGGEEVAPFVWAMMPQGRKGHSYAIKDNIFMVRVPGPGADNVLWCAHCDTVNYTTQYAHPTVTERDYFLVADPAAHCLGADDRAGCLILANMIANDVPGTYVLFPDEEEGAHASFLFTEALKDCEFVLAVEFDRKGTTEIITHQLCGTRLCTDETATSIGAALAKHGLGDYLKPSDDGLFTDVANLFPVVPQVVNMAVGYYAQHTKSEYLDLRYLYDLTSALISWGTSQDFADFITDLIVNPRKVPVEKAQKYSHYRSWNAWDSDTRDYEIESWYAREAHTYTSTADQKMVQAQKRGSGRYTKSHTLSADQRNFDSFDEYIEAKMKEEDDYMRWAEGSSEIPETVDLEDPDEGDDGLTCDPSLLTDEELTQLNDQLGCLWERD